MATVYRRPDEEVEKLIRRFKKKVIEEEILIELRKREYYMSPSIKRKEKAKRAKYRRLLDQRKAKKYQKNTDEE